jgi:hypothetical protein
MSAKDLQDALVQDWQEIEHNLSIAIKPLGIGLDQAIRGQLPEARSMRGLMRRIRVLDRKLGREAQCIAELNTASAIGALAKIRMVLRIWCPHEDEKEAWTLLSSSVEQLAEFIER